MAKHYRSKIAKLRDEWRSLTSLWSGMEGIPPGVHARFLAIIEEVRKLAEAEGLDYIEELAFLYESDVSVEEYDEFNQHDKVVDWAKELSLTNDLSRIPK